MADEPEVSEAVEFDDETGEEIDFLPSKEADTPVSGEDVRPEWLPEKYTSGEELASAYSKLESKLGERKSKLAEDIEAERLSGRPESAGDYLLPESIGEDESVDNELLNWWANHAYENGYGQEVFEAGIEQYRQAYEGSAPDLDAEREKLGDHATERTEAASAFASKFFPEEVHSALERMCETSEGIVALEYIMESMQEPTFGGEAENSPQLSQEKLHSMMMDERYTSINNRDPEYVKEVARGFERLYGS